MNTEPEDNPPWPPSDAKPGDTWGDYILCEDGFWRLFVNGEGVMP